MNRKKIIRYITNHNLFAPGDKILVALSGGADSVALLRILIELGYSCEAAHCNFHLRGDESERDEQFVRQLCGQLQVPVYVAHFNTEQEAKELFDLAEAQGVTVQCYQNRRFDSDYLTAKQVLASGKLGRVFEVVTSYDYFRPHQMDGQAYDKVNSAAYGHATHCLDQLIAWFGAPDHFHAETRQLNGPGRAVDYFDYDLYYDDRNLKATAHANYATAFLRPSFEIYGDRGAYIKMEKDQQERDLKHFYLPVGHDDFGLDAPEQYGVLRYVDDEGVLCEERVPTVRSTYSLYYDALYETVAHGAPRLVKPEETLAQMRILEAGMVGKH